MTCPTDQNVREAAVELPHAWDPGNIAWDIMFNVLRMWQFIQNESSRVARQVFPSDVHGTSATNSGKGPCSFRGNILEATLAYCMRRGSSEQDLKEWDAERKARGGQPLRF